MSEQSLSSAFTQVTFPDGISARIPSDIQLRFPISSSLPLDQQHYLIDIPWEESYLQHVPQEYQSFFSSILPYLVARTTDVHTAVCMAYLDEFIRRAQADGHDPDRDVIAYALMLHDSGWSQMSEGEVADSLGVKGLVLTDRAMGPKEKHAVIGAQIARDTLMAQAQQLGLSPAQIDLIVTAIRYHDKPEAVAGASAPMPIEVRLLVDLDHIWSFTHQNFWQDTIRKGVPPRAYAANLAADLDGYFVTEIGKSTARALLAEREREVDLLELEEKV